MLNGNTIELGVCYYPEHWDTSFWKEDMLRMKSYGIGVIRVAAYAGSIRYTDLHAACLADGKIPGSIKL